MDPTRLLSPEPPEVDDNEVPLDVFNGSKQIRGLSSASTLQEVMAKFGYQPDDRLGRREQVVIFRTTQKAFEQRIDRLVRARLYDEARRRRQALEVINEAFHDLQRKETRREHEKQARVFEQGRKLAIAKLAVRQEAAVQQCEEQSAGLHARLAKQQRFREESLEREIEGCLTPRRKNSTRLQYLVNAEKNLVRLYQYDDAKNVAAMIRRLEPQEVAAHTARCAHALQLRREQLREHHEEEQQRLHESSTAAKCKDARRRDAEKKLLQQRIKNLYWDMAHSHAMEDRLRPEMAINPSALLQKRPGYRLTGSGLRGQQWLDTVKGKKDKRDAVYVTTLTDIHDFKSPADGTEVIAA